VQRTKILVVKMDKWRVEVELTVACFITSVINEWFNSKKDFPYADCFSLVVSNDTEFRENSLLQKYFLNHCQFAFFWHTAGRSKNTLLFHTDFK